MPDEKADKAASPLSSGVHAPEFVPASQQARGTSTNVNAKPFVPAAQRGSSGALGADARPFVPANGTSSISAAANEFVPQSLSYQGMSTSAPEFVPRGAPSSQQGGRGARPPQRAELRIPDGVQPSGFPVAHRTAQEDLRAPNAHLMPGPVALRAAARPGFVPYGVGNSPGRGGRVRGSPQQLQASPPFAPGSSSQKGGGRYPPGRGLEGRGRGRAPFQPPGSPGYQPGFSPVNDALSRMHHNAVAQAEQLAPQLQHQSYLELMQMPPELQAERGLPDMVQQFHSLCFLEDMDAAEEAGSRVLGVQSVVLKGVSMQDGQAYVLRKINYRQVPPSPELVAFANEVVDAWSGLQLHPHLAVPRHAFVSMEIGGALSFYIGHDYYPGALTLEAAHLQPQLTANGLVQVTSVAESTLWSYLMQLAAALRAVHSTGMACRAALHTSKVLLTSAGRLRIGSLGVAEILGGTSSRQDELAALQREDLQALGRLLLQLACCTPQHVSIEVCSTHFSPELTGIIAGLLGHQEPITSWQQLTAALGDHAFEELDASHIYSDAVTSQLTHEMENGRLLRVLAKLSMITERADLETSWAETGDRYLLKLFRDFVFHQCTEEGTPILDWGHVIECLNKLDAGTPEKIVLLSRDEASMLVVSYADIKRCIEGTFGELKKMGAAAARPLTPPVRPRTPL